MVLALAGGACLDVVGGYFGPVVVEAVFADAGEEEGVFGFGPGADGDCVVRGSGSGCGFGGYWQCGGNSKGRVDGLMLKVLRLLLDIYIVVVAVFLVIRRDGG